MGMGFYNLQKEHFDQIKKSDTILDSNGNDVSGSISLSSFNGANILGTAYQVGRIETSTNQYLIDDEVIFSLILLFQ